MPKSITLDFSQKNIWMLTSGERVLSPGQENYFYLLFAEEIVPAFAQIAQQYPHLKYRILTQRCLHLSSPETIDNLTGSGWELCTAPATLPIRPKLISFDMDSTLICQEVIDEIAREKGCYDEVAAITEAAMRGELDFDQSLTKRVSCLKGLSEARLARVFEQLTFSPGAEKLLQQLNQWQIKTIILSGGFDFFAEKIAAKLCIKNYYANRLEIQKGRLTGKVIPPIMNAQSKAEHLIKIALRENIALENTVAVGDGANDLLVLNQAGLGIAWHAKPAVNKQADVAIKVSALDVISWIWD